MFYNTYSISNDEIHTIRRYFGTSWSYGSRCWERCIGYNTYTEPMIRKRYNSNPIQGCVLNNDRKIHYKRD